MLQTVQVCRYSNFPAQCSVLLSVYFSSVTVKSLKLTTPCCPEILSITWSPFPCSQRRKSLSATSAKDTNRLFFNAWGFFSRFVCIELAVAFLPSGFRNCWISTLGKKYIKFIILPEHAVVGSQSITLVLLWCVLHMTVNFNLHNMDKARVFKNDLLLQMCLGWRNGKTWKCINPCIVLLQIKREAKSCMSLKPPWNYFRKTSVNVHCFLK